MSRFVDFMLGRDDSPPESPVSVWARQENLSLEDLQQMIRQERSDPDWLGGHLLKLPIVFACFRQIVTRLQEFRPVVRRDGAVLPVPAWIRSPSELWSWADVVSQAIWSLLMWGHIWLWPQRDGMGRPTGVIVVPPDSVSIVRVTGRRVLPETMILVDGLPGDDLVHTRYLALPGEPSGLGIFDVSRRARQVSAYSEETLLRHFQQAAKLSVVFASKSPMTPDTLKEANRIVRSNYESVTNWWRPVVLPDGTVPHVVAANADHGGYLELSQWSDARIAAQIFGIDPTLLGINLPGSQLTYNNARDRTGNLWRDALRPVANRLEEAFTKVALGSDTTVGLDETAVLVGGPQDRADYAGQLMGINAQAGGWVFTADEIRSAAGYRPGDPPAPFDRLPSPS